MIFRIYWDSINYFCTDLYIQCSRIAWWGRTVGREKYQMEVYFFPHKTWIDQSSRNDARKKKIGKISLKNSISKVIAAKYWDKSIEIWFKFAFTIQLELEESWKIANWLREGVQISKTDPYSPSFVVLSFGWDKKCWELDVIRHWV